MAGKRKPIKASRPACPSGKKRNQYGRCVKLTTVDKAKGIMKKFEKVAEKGGEAVDKFIWGNYGRGKKYYKNK